MRLILLDEPVAVVGGRSYDLPAQKPVLLLVYLACRQGWVGRDELVTLFWPEEDESVARHNLRTLLMRARRLPWAEALEADPSRISLRVDCDVHAFKDAIGRSDWAEAAELHRQPLLSGWSVRGAAGFEAWLELERESLLSVWRNASLMRAAELRAGGRHAEGASLLARYLAHDRLAEDVLGGYLEAAYQAGHRAEALVAYDRFADYLERELGLTPLPETSRLAEAIRDGAALATTAPQGFTRSLPQALERPVRLVGRVEELKLLSTSAARLLVVSGEPGVGKSRLVEEAAPDAHWLRAQEGLKGVPFHPIVGLVKERIHSLSELGRYREDLARLVPEVAPDIVPGALEPQIAKARLFEAVARALEGLGTALVFDDLQWADDNTLEVLSLVCSRGRVRCFGTYRSGEVSAALHDLLRGERARGGLTELRLGPLGAQAIRDLLAALIGVEEGPPVFASWLHTRSAGNPLFALETLTDPCIAS